MKRYQVGSKEFLNIKFNRLTVISPIFKRFYAGRNRSFVTVKCDCNKIYDVCLQNILNDATMSCGCLNKYRVSEACRKYGEEPVYNTRLYGIWQHMKDRCYNINSNNYCYYGGRNIKLCDEWLNYNNFRKWANINSYNDTLTIERINVNEDYSPENCKWIPQSEQPKNTTRTLYFTLFGETKSLNKWKLDTRLKISPQLLAGRINRGWDFESAFTLPNHGKVSSKNI